MYYVNLKKKNLIYLEWGGPNDSLAPWLSILGGGHGPLAPPWLRHWRKEGNSKFSTWTASLPCQIFFKIRKSFVYQLKLFDFLTKSLSVYQNSCNTGIRKQIIFIHHLFLTNNFFPNKMNTFSLSGQTGILLSGRPRGSRLSAWWGPFKPLITILPWC